MAITYTWSILNTTYETATGGIISASWRCVGTHEDGTTDDLRSTVHLAYDADDPDFVPYADVTEPMVLGWVQARLDVAAIEAEIAEEIDELQHPVIASGLPWETAA